MKTKEELSRIAKKAWKTRRANQARNSTEVPKEYAEAAGQMLQENKRHLAAVKAAATRKRNLEARAKYNKIIPLSADKGIIEKTTRIGPSETPMRKENKIEKHGIECAKLLGKMVGVRAFATVFQVGDQVWRLKISRLKRMPPSKPVC